MKPETRRALWIAAGVAGVVAVVLTPGGTLIAAGVKMAADKVGEVVQRMTGKRAIRAAFRAAARQYGLNPDWLDALAGNETRWAPATNMIGPDGERGGAFGPTQITERTARAFGYLMGMDVLNDDPAAAADVTARMVLDGFAERKVNGVSRTFHYGPPATFEQMLTVWNAGRLPDDPGLPARTRDEYLPRAATYLAKAQKDGAALDAEALA